MTDVAILGCGPAGLLAAHGAVQMGFEPHIFSVKKKSVMPGAMYVHERIDDVTEAEPDGVITFRKTGNRAGYAQKVYGDAQAPVSWDQFPVGEYPAWSMSALYDTLWDRYGGSIIDQELGTEAIGEIAKGHRLTISTIPAHQLCYEGHHFGGQPVWISENSWAGVGENEIVYNGDLNDHWYRSSRIFGHEATESAQQMPSAFQGTKPLSTDCDCQPEVVRVGRFGQWKKGVLVHHAYRESMEALQWAFGKGEHAL